MRGRRLVVRQERDPIVSEQPKSWARRHPKLARLLLVVVPAAVVLAAAEVALRATGTEPGWVERYSKKAFRRVETLVVKDRFVTDPDGVYRANPTPTEPWPGFEVNSEGFRSREFAPAGDGEGTSVLFLGDSFTWGIAARPLSNSFVDLVGRAGYAVFNTGIPRTHPKQYAALAERYVPRVKPDVVAVMFFMGNDFADAPPMLPGKNIYHQTNAGDLSAVDLDGEWMDPETAYRYWASKSNAVVHPDPSDGSFSAMLRRASLSTAVGTRLLAAVTAPPPEAPVLTAKEAGEVRRRRRRESRGYLERIAATAARHGAEFRLFLIPVRPEKRNPGFEIPRNLRFFEGLDPIVPDVEFPSSDYEKMPGWHFNDAGHRKYAELILRHLPS